MREVVSLGFDHLQCKHFIEGKYESDFGGEGFKPWLCDPGSVIVITDGRDPSVFDTSLQKVHPSACDFQPNSSEILQNSIHTLLK
jgi:hypothetical protein